MGGEILIFIGAGLAAFVFLLLSYRAFIPTARPYAIPTIIFASAVGVYEASIAIAGNTIWLFLFWFLLGALVFGAHAHAIMWFRERRP